MNIYEFMADNTLLTMWLSGIGALTTHFTATGCAKCMAAHKEHKDG